MQKLEKTVPLFQLLQWKYGLQLEMKGMKNSRGSIYAHVKRTFGWKGNRQKIYDKLCDFLEGLP
tara:strand:+ start:603 stop:794 length:192 start_codon:yes stop_codon:yes gene_type:complete